MAGSILIRPRWKVNNMETEMRLELISRLPKEPARDYALRFLRQNILSLRLAPGTMASTADIAEMIGVSRTPVREAMQELGNSGLLEIFPQAGSRVSFIDYDVIHESSAIRRTIETSIVALACDAITPESEQAFRDLLFDHDRLVRRNGNEGFLDADRAFHRQLYVLTGRLFTYQTLENCLWHFDRLRALSFNAVSVELFLGDHAAIFDAIARRDKKEARRLTVRHLTRYLKDERIIRDKYPHYFAPPR